MKKDMFKEQFADATARAFRTVYADKYRENEKGDVFDPEFIYRALEKPKDPRMGRFALPVFRFARQLGDSPDNVAARVAPETNQILQTNAADGPIVESIPVRGFLNARVSPVALAARTLVEILESENQYGSSHEGQGQKYLVEYSSPNIAKPFGVGHLRTTILGNSLRRIFQKLGYDVVGINYLGDWGTQFGKMIVAFDKWGNEAELDDHAVEKLYDLYVRFHDEAEQDESLNEQARAAFRRLELGEQHETELWERFKKLSWAEFDRIYRTLGVEFDLVTGESFLNDKMEPLIERLEKAGLTRLSDGALIVDLDDPQLPPCLLKKADGATLYSTRDLAGLVWRWENFRFYECLYVVAVAQSDHFKQVYRVIELLEEAEKVPQSEHMAGRARHVDFGWVKFQDKTMSTRRGNIIILEEVLDKAVRLAEQKIREKNPELLEKEARMQTGLGLQHLTALMIGVGAVVFSQLAARRQKDINFDWDEVLNFEGETGPYLQYTHARLCSLMRNYTGEITAEVDFSLLNHDEENRVIEMLADFPDAIGDAARSYDPHFIAACLLRLASSFNKVYQRKDADGRIDKIVSDNSDLSAARIALVKAVQIVLAEGLSLLGLQAPQEM